MRALNAMKAGHPSLRMMRIYLICPVAFEAVTHRGTLTAMLRLHTWSVQAQPPGTAAGWLAQIPNQRGQIRMICTQDVQHQRGSAQSIDVHDR